MRISDWSSDVCSSDLWPPPSPCPCWCCSSCDTPASALDRFALRRHNPDSRIAAEDSHCMTAPLTGLRVFDLTRILAGTPSTQLLGDLGAEVLKVVRHGPGHDNRKHAKAEGGAKVCAYG